MCFDVLDEGCVGGGETETRKGWTGGKENERGKRNAEDTRKRKKKKALGWVGGGTAKRLVRLGGGVVGGGGRTGERREGGEGCVKRGR